VVPTTAVTGGVVRAMVTSKPVLLGMGVAISTVPAKKGTNDGSGNECAAVSVPSAGMSPAMTSTMMASAAVPAAVVPATLMTACVMASTMSVSVSRP